jgi:hypothetical protein
MISVEAVMTAPRRPALPQWKIDLVREASVGGPEFFCGVCVAAGLALRYDSGRKHLSR